jgi:hypothetical protein
MANNYPFEIHRALKNALQFSFPLVFTYHVIHLIHGPFAFEMQWIQNSFSSVYLAFSSTLFRPFAMFEGPPYLSFYYLLCSVFIATSSQKNLLKFLGVSICLVMSFLTYTTTFSVAFIISYCVILLFSKRIYLLKFAFFGILSIVVLMIASFNYIVPFFNKAGSNFQNPVIQERLSLGTFAGRIMNLSASMEKIKMKPLGYGSGQISTPNIYFKNNLAGTIDNGFLATSINLGILGTVLILIFIYQATIKSFIKFKSTKVLFYKYASIIPISLLVANITTEIFCYKFIIIFSMAFFSIIFSKSNLLIPTSKVLGT